MNSKKLVALSVQTTITIPANSGKPWKTLQNKVSEFYVNHVYAGVIKVGGYYFYIGYKTNADYYAFLIFSYNNTAYLFRKYSTTSSILYEFTKTQATP